MNSLTDKAVFGGVAKLCAQAVTFVLRLGSTMVLARLLEPSDFGLVGMVTAVTGAFALFRDFGLSSAAIQRPRLSNQQSSTLFWINIAMGGVLTVLAVAVAPIAAEYYREPRLIPIMFALAVSYLLTAAGAQHLTLLHRQMRFTAVAAIDVFALLVSSGLGVAMALRGTGYWSLIAITLSASVITTLAAWAVTRWVPGLPRRNTGVRSMLTFGGTLTLNNLVVYLAYNIEKLLLGGFWGPEAIGLYGRAYQLSNIPNDNVNSAAGSVALSALSRVRKEPDRFRRYFLNGYSFMLSMTLPMTIGSSLLAAELIYVVLGPSWSDAAPIFQLLAPGAVVFSVINPLGWLLLSQSKVKRSLYVALALAPLIIAGYVVGLPHGPRGVAFGSSAVLVLWAIPHICWCVQGTGITLGDIAKKVCWPLVASAVAGTATLIMKSMYGPLLPPLSRLGLAGTAFAGIYVITLFYVLGQKTIYQELVQWLKVRTTAASARAVRYQES